VTSRQSIRNTLKKQRRQLPATLRQEASIKIKSYISATRWFKRSKHLAFYLPVNGELNPQPLLHYALEAGKACYLPICHPFHSQSLWFVPYQLTDTLAYNRYSILEPVYKGSPRKPFTLDIVFIPLVAFDAHGNRLGSGKGYYDRTFAYLNSRRHYRKPLLVGLAYDFQQVTELSSAWWDVGMDKVIVFDRGRGDCFSIVTSDSRLRS
jgi:5-formyltetrahydrofolate cyclo-ligase